MSEANLQTTAAALQAPYSQGGLTFSRRFSTEGISPYDDVQWERRTALIADSKGNTIFEQKDVEVPVDWSMTATNIVASKYLHGTIGSPERETGVRQLVSRVAETVRDWGIAGGYFASDNDAAIFHDELAQHAADAEGGVQFAGLVQRGLRPAGAVCGRAKLALGPDDGRRGARGDGLQESAVLGLLH